MQEGCIAFYSRSLYFGGIERNIVSHAIVLKEKGFKVLIVSAKNSSITKSSDQQGIELISIENEKILTIRKLVRELLNKKVKAIFIFKPKELRAALIIKLLSRFKIKVIYCQQENINFNKYRLYKTILLKLTDYWITPLNYLRKKMQDNRWFRGKNILVMPHYLKLETFLSSKLSVSEARLKLKLPEDRIMLGIMGRQNMEKRQDFLIRAINFLKINNYSFDLLIMGNPKRSEEKEYAQFLKELSTECGLENHVHFRSYSNNIITFYRAIDVLIRTTSGEACDVTPIEAMAAGTPVLSVQSDYNTEIMENGNLGILYKANNLEDFSSKLLKLLTHQKIIDHLKTEAQQAMREKYDMNFENHPIELFIRGLIK
jgi:glycosyltransferase involved in cell wall biosynthesis